MLVDDDCVLALIMHLDGQAARLLAARPRPAQAAVARLALAIGRRRIGDAGDLIFGRPGAPLPARPFAPFAQVGLGRRLAGGHGRHALGAPRRTFGDLRVDALFRDVDAEGLGAAEVQRPFIAAVLLLPPDRDERAGRAVGPLPR